MRAFVIIAYAAFWTLILGLGGLASMVLHAPPRVMTAITVLCSWSPTIVLLVMMKRLKPGLSIREFYARAFSGRLRPGPILLAPAMAFGASALAAMAVSFAEGARFVDRFIVDPAAFPKALLLMVFLGPSGEESAWRGYLRPELEAKYGFLKGNIILGLVWAFWHTPLWLVSSDFRGWEGLVFAAANVIVLASLTVLMGVFLKRNDNLLLAFWIHYCFNISLIPQAGGIGFFVALSVVYLAAAAAAAAFHLGTDSRRPHSVGAAGPL
ncbi:MAG: CPBP family intramembrane metalloprotease [Spirochaetaceae bacterium]|nr:CPBP family intramembrane metalloprotease [Spirochaetaceae bacterium]